MLSNHVFQGYYPASEIGDVPTFAQTLVNSSFSNDIQPFSGFTSGQYNGLIRNGEDVDVLSGELTVSRGTKADIMLGDGIIIHKIDTVLSFGPAFLTYLPRAGLRGASGALSSVDTGLNLGNPGDDGETGADVTNLTFFIPNDVAFENIASVLSTANEITRREVLRYHVVEDNVIFSPSWSNRSIETVQGGELQLTLGEDEAGEEVVWVNGAKVVFPNVIVFNGVVHINDQVVNPLSPPPSRIALYAAAPVADRVQLLVATSSSPLPFTSFSFGTEFSNPYTTAPLLTTYQPVAEPAGMTSTSTALVVYTGGASVRYAVEVVKVVVAVAVGGVALGGAS